MNSTKERKGYPFGIVAGKSLGYQTQSDQTELPLSQRTYGQAKLNYVANVATGNLVAEDRRISIDDISGTFQIGYTYNSLANHPTAWHLNALKKLKIETHVAGWFSYFNKKAPDLSIIEADGHETTYVRNTDGSYYANDYVKGRGCIRFDETKNQYQLVDPSSHVTEIFDMKGHLIERMDENQNKTHFNYDEKTGELQTVLFPSGKKCEVRREGETVKIYIVETNKSEKLLNTYQFKNGNLESSVTPDGYETRYNYDANGKLAHVSQSDGSVMGFGYDEKQGKLNDISVGHDSYAEHYRFTFENNKTVLTDSLNSTVTMTFDENKRIRECNKADTDITHYDYTPEGQPEKIIYPDGGQESFSYENKTGLLKQHIQRNKETIDYQYSPEEKNAFSQLISKGSITSAKTRYVYDGNLLRFSITPEGFVKEFEYSDKCLMKNEFAYYNDKFTQHGIPDLLAMDDWKKHNERLEHRTHTSYEHNNQGQVIEQIAHGETKSSDAVTCYRYDHLGRIIYKSVKTDENKCIESTFTYNDNGDLTKTTIGPESGKTTEYAYIANTIKTTHPNGSYERETFDARHVLIKKIIDPNDGTPKKEINYQRDGSGRVHVFVEPDNIQTRQFYDNQNRLRFTLSPLGRLTQFNYDTRHRYQAKIEYADEFKASDTPTLAQLEEWVNHADTTKARVSSSIFGLNDKVQFSIDAENYLTENQYDAQNNLVSVIKYAARLTHIELEQLKKGTALTRNPDRLQDKIITYYYNRDNEKIGEHDERGYLTVFNKDPLGRLTETIIYQNPIPTILKTFEQPNENYNKGAHTYFYYNHLNQCTLEVDAEGYITTHNYFADGQKQSTTRYENKVDSSWLDKAKPPIPQNSLFGNDHKTTYAYDDLGRLQETVTSSGKATRYVYDVMDNILETYTYDLDANFSEQKELGDIYRGHAAQYNGLNQVAAENNVFVSEKLKLISHDHHLTHEEKDIQKAELWKSHSTRHQYNASGLKIKTIDPLGHATLYYYDQEGNCRLTIDPMGSVIENQFNCFGEVLLETHYYHRIEPAELETLTGGYENTDILAIIKKDPEKDVVTKFTRDNRGQVTEKIDPENHQSTYEYDAFKRCFDEKISVHNLKPSLNIVREFDANDHEIKKIIAPMTKDLSDAKAIVVESKFDHFSGVMTESMDEMGTKTHYQPDHLGRITEVSKELEANVFKTEMITEYDAFSQTTKITDANHHSTDFLHHQLGRTTTALSPMKDSAVMTTKNIFDETVQRAKVGLCEDAKNTKTRCQLDLFEHAPDGQVRLHAAGKKAIQTQFNLLGQEEKIKDSSNVITELTYNPSGHLTDEVIHAGNEKKALHHECNALGQSEWETDALGMKSKIEYNRCGDIAKKTLDIEGEKVSTSYSRNAQGSETSRVVSDDKHADLLNIKTCHDSFGRMEAEVVDPDDNPNLPSGNKALNIENYVVKDAIGNIIKKIDPNKNELLFFYDKSQQKRFELKPRNKNQFTLTEWQYTATGKVASVRVYHQPIESTSISHNLTMTKLTKLAEADDHHDVVTLYYYDAKDRERFNVQLFSDIHTQGIHAKVVEKKYDALDCEIEHTNYLKSLEANDYLSWNTERLNHQVIRTPHKDRTYHYFYDIDSDLRFTIDQDGRVTENIYSKTGQLITKVEYSSPILDCQHKTADEIAECLKKEKNLPKHVHHTVYDTFGREKYTVDPNGVVMQKDYDHHGNVLRECLYKAFVSPSRPYETLVETLKALVPDRNRDSITEYEYTKLGFLASKTDALGYKDVFERDALGNLTFHTDRAQNKYGFEYDRAKRLVNEISPKTTIAVVKQDANGQLTFKEKTTTVTKKTDFDKNGNAKAITEGILEGMTDDEYAAQTRKVEFSYTPQNYLERASLSNITVDDEKKPVNISKQTVWDEHHRKIVEIDESNNPIFHIYDNAGRLLFDIDAEKAVTEHRYDSFNQQTMIIDYAKKWDVDLSRFLTSGITPQLIKDDFLDKVRPDNDNRIKQIEYYSSGKISKITNSAVVYYVDGELGVAQPEYTKEYSLNGERAVESTLVSPGVWSKKHYWYQYNEQLVAEVDDLNHVTLYEYNAMGKPVQKLEVALPLSAKPALDTTLATLENQIKLSEKDREYQYEYDQLGQRITEVVKDVSTENLVLENNKPKVEKRPKADLIRRTKYSPLQKETQITYEDSSVDHKFYDARHIKIAETQVSR